MVRRDGLGTGKEIRSAVCAQSRRIAGEVGPGQRTAIPEHVGAQTPHAAMEIDLGQAVAACKCLVVDGSHRARDRKRRQAKAIVESRIIDIGHPDGNRHRRQPPAFVAELAGNGGQADRNVECRQVAAVQENGFAHVGQAIRQVHAVQGAAAGECAVPDGRDAGGNGHGAEVGAAVEQAFGDAVQAAGQNGRLQGGTALEGIGADVGDDAAVGKGETGDVRAKRAGAPVDGGDGIAAEGGGHDQIVAGGLRNRGDGCRAVGDRVGEDVAARHGSLRQREVVEVHLAGFGVFGICDIVRDLGGVKFDAGDVAHLRDAHDPGHVFRFAAATGGIDRDLGRAGLGERPVHGGGAVVGQRRGPVDGDVLGVALIDDDDLAVVGRVEDEALVAGGIAGVVVQPELQRKHVAGRKGGREIPRHGDIGTGSFGHVAEGVPHAEAGIRAGPDSVSGPARTRRRLDAPGLETPAAVGAVGPAAAVVVGRVHVHGGEGKNRVRQTKCGQHRKSCARFHVPFLIGPW